MSNYTWRFNNSICEHYNLYKLRLQISVKSTLLIEKLQLYLLLLVFGFDIFNLITKVIKKSPYQANTSEVNLWFQIILKFLDFFYIFDEHALFYNSMQWLLCNKKKNNEANHIENFQSYYNDKAFFMLQLFFFPTNSSCLDLNWLPAQSSRLSLCTWISCRP